MKICSLGITQATVSMEEMFVLYAAFVGLPVGPNSSSHLRNKMLHFESKTMAQLEDKIFYYLVEYMTEITGFVNSQGLSIP